MRTVSAVEMRKRFGEIVDQAAAGERIVIERAGQPLAAIVPIADLAALNPAERQRGQLAAIDELRRRAHAFPLPPADTVALVRRMRQERTAQILGATTRRPG